MSMKHETEVDAAEAFERALTKVRQSEHWMAAAWSVEGGRVTLVGRTTYKFPRGDFLAAVGLLAAKCMEDCEEDRDKLPDAPLPRAFPKVFGGKFAEDADRKAAIDLRPERKIVDAIHPTDPPQPCHVDVGRKCLSEEEREASERQLESGLHPDVVLPDKAEPQSVCMDGQTEQTPPPVLPEEKWESVQDSRTHEEKERRYREEQGREDSQAETDRLRKVSRSLHEEPDE